jgi:hypothetical protein
VLSAGPFATPSSNTVNAGVPMVFWENGKIVHVPADQVPLPEVEE